jgi:hypothetical protein
MGSSRKGGMSSTEPVMQGIAWDVSGPSQRLSCGEVFIPPVSVFILFKTFNEKED